MKRRHHTPEQIVRKLREADRMLGEDLPMVEVCKHLEVTSRNAGGIKVGFTRDIRMSGLQIVKTGEDSLIRADGATLLLAGSVIDGCLPLVSVGGALPRQLLAAAGYNAGRVEQGLSGNGRMSCRK